MAQNTDKNFTASLATRFNTLNRAILVAEQPEQWQPAIAAMNAFLSELKAWLRANPEQIAEDLVTSSRVFQLAAHLSCHRHARPAGALPTQGGCCLASLPPGVR